MARSLSKRDPHAMDEREFAEFYAGCCAECESGGVEPFSPDTIAEFLAVLGVLDLDALPSWKALLH